MTRLIVATLLLFAAMPVHAQRRDLQTVQTPERRLALIVGNEAMLNGHCGILSTMPK